MSPRPSRRVITAVASLALAAGALAGCAGWSAHPGQAAVVSYTDADGTRQHTSISVETVEDATAELAPALGVASADVLEGLVYLPVLESLAAEYGIVVTDEDAVAALEGQLGPGDYSQASIDYARSILIGQGASALDQEALAEIQARYSEAASAVDVEVAPRYNGVRPWILSTQAAGLEAG